MLVFTPANPHTVPRGANGIWPSVPLLKCHNAKCWAGLPRLCLAALHRNFCSWVTLRQCLVAVKTCPLKWKCYQEGKYHKCHPVHSVMTKNTKHHTVAFCSLLLFQYYSEFAFVSVVRKPVLYDFNIQPPLGFWQSRLSKWTIQFCFHDR